jgi:hypothetical protein
VKLIETKTLAVAVASIEFTSIPQDGSDLVLTCSHRSANGGFADEVITVYWNNTQSGYTARRLVGTGSGTFTDTLTNNNGGGAGSRVPIGGSSGSTTTANTFSNTTAYFPNYSGSTAKSVLGDGVGENNATTAIQSIHSGLTSSTSAITSITITQYWGTSIAVGSTFSLYKITKGSDGIVTVS